MGKIKFEKQKYKIIEVEEIKKHLSESEQTTLNYLLDKIYGGMTKEGKSQKHYEVIVKDITPQDLLG